MAKRTDMIGSGMTERKVIKYSGQDMDPAFRQASKRRAAALNDGGGEYGAITLSLVQQLQPIVEGAGNPPHDAHSLEDFAARILAYHRMAGAEVRAGNADEAARYAFKAGYLYAEATMKFRHEPLGREGKPSCKLASVLPSRRMERSRSERNGTKGAAAPMRSTASIFQRCRHTKRRDGSAGAVGGQFGKL